MNTYAYTPTYTQVANKKSSFGGRLPLNNYCSD